MKRFFYLLLILFILCSNLKSEAQEAPAPPQNAWTDSIQDVTIYWSWDNTAKRAVLLPDVNMDGIGMGVVGNRAVANQCITDNLSMPLPAGMDLAIELMNCISCCGVFPLSDGTERFYMVGPSDANMARRQILNSYCLCECARTAAPTGAGAMILCAMNDAMAQLNENPLEQFTSCQEYFEDFTDLVLGKDYLYTSLSNEPTIPLSDPVITPEQTDVFEITVPENLVPQDEVEKIDLAPIPLSE